eukprot:m.198572 g.198572  ORF g.198572 m.198572 type:complete len:145 (-) comp18753_c0_seq1:588-1022(-)
MAQQTGSRLARHIDFKGVPLIAVTHDSDVRKALNFRDSAFKHANPPASIFLDEERNFYGGIEQGIFEALSHPGFYRNMAQYLLSSDKEDLNPEHGGEFRYLGGVVVYGPGDTGIVYEEHEQSMGEAIDLEKIQQAVDKIARSPK